MSDFFTRFCEYGVNDRIPLKTSSVTFVLPNGDKLRGSGELFFDLKQGCQVSLLGTIAAEGMEYRDKLKMQLDPASPLLQITRAELDSGTKVNFDGFTTSVSWPGTNCVVEYSPHGVVNCPISSSLDAKCVIFHLCNFQAIQREPVVMCNGEWEITIAPLPDIGKRLSEVRVPGSWAITHCGMLSKLNSETFDSEEAEIAFSRLSTFLSFVRGVELHPALHVACGTNQEILYEKWGSARVAHRSRDSNWFDGFKDEQLSSLYPLFSRSLDEDQWRLALNDAIYWYNLSNLVEVNMDAGLILCQAALERLSWTYAATVPSGPETPSKKDRTSTYLRYMLRGFSIPTDVPAELATLKNFCEQKDIEDGPHVITELRNALCHGEPRKEHLINQLDAIIYDIWRLAQWHIELAILAHCGYVGDYSNRLKRRIIGEYEQVPWSEH